MRTAAPYDLVFTLMMPPQLQSLMSTVCDRQWWRRLITTALLGVCVVLGCSLLVGVSPAHAVLTDDHYDGNIFPLYAGNGYLVPPKVTLKDALSLHNPALLVFYVDDSTDCKQFAPVVSQLDAYYGRVSDFIPISVDTLPLNANFAPTDPGYYYTGLVPQTVLLDQQGNVVLNETGIVSFEKIDDAFRKVFDLLPRSESVELKRRPVNEISTELVK